ncbi:hypothetical protein [Paenibacillus massiliensis]|uniref:hypothetical protein n=1 Tax=Paenibacillus massiliensis TaxID=225917 RepID=UPI000375213D|nr:hypothetical protein [Paenibacillus massiliensis]
MMYKDPLSQADLAYERYNKLSPPSSEPDIPESDMEYVGTVTDHEGLASIPGFKKAEPVRSALADPFEVRMRDSRSADHRPRGPGSALSQERSDT